MELKRAKYSALLDERPLLELFNGTIYTLLHVLDLKITSESRSIMQRLQRGFKTRDGDWPITVEYPSHVHLRLVRFSLSFTP